MTQQPPGEVDLAVFPGDFAWGVATAAYQIEGAVATGGRGPSIWDTFAHTPGATLHGDTGDIACDHYSRWEDDLDLLADLGVTDYRLSLSWSRLQPTGRGELNADAVDFYAGVLIGLRRRGIDAWVTLYHWDLPETLEREGGWPERATALRFASYVRRVLARLGRLADNWITLNEPWCSSVLGYGRGVHAPGRRNLRAAVAAAHHLNLAHGLALEAIRGTAPHARVGVTNLLTDIRPETERAEDVAAAVRLDAISNRLFMDPVYRGGYSSAVHEALDPYGLAEAIDDDDLRIIGGAVDFAGVNHYQRVLARADAGEPFGVRETPAAPATTSFGWSVSPDPLTDVLVRVRDEWTTLPQVVTESGASFHDYVDPTGTVRDTERIDYLTGYFRAAAEAIRRGVDLRGYFVWSFLDNYEWAEGYSKRFGLVYVDYRTQERIPKQSAAWYRDLILRHATTTRTPGAVA